jgi:hypothetical protein
VQKTDSKKAERAKPQTASSKTEEVAPAVEAASIPAQGLSVEAKKFLQSKMDLLDDDMLDRVLDFLEPELGNSDGDEVQLNIDLLSVDRLHALVKVVDAELAAASGAASSAIA